jgi:hypothetical protein
MMTLCRFKFLFFAGLPVTLLISLNTPAAAQTVTIDAFVDHKGEKIPSICLISSAPPKDLCGHVLQGFTRAELQSLRATTRRQMEGSGNQ